MRLASILVVFLASTTTWAADAIPTCLAYGRPLAVNNDQVLHWRRTTPNQFRERAHVTGTVVHIYPDKNGHEHFAIQLGKHEDDRIEIIYNQDFGALPNLIQEGMQIEACGDYITSTAQSGPYPPSPEGAIVHWVHLNPKGKGHDSGFLVIDGTLFGTDIRNAGPKPRDQFEEQLEYLEELL